MLTYGQKTSQDVSYIMAWDETVCYQDSMKINLMVFKMVSERIMYVYTDI